MMSKRRRKDIINKIPQSNDTDDSLKPEDYTADFESYEFENNGTADNENLRESTRQSTQHDSYDTIKTDYSNLIDNNDEQNTDNLCRDYVRNVCRRGRKCKYKHPTATQSTWINKIDTKAQVNQFEVNFCHDYQNNGCNRPQCRFIHCNRPEQEFYYATGILLSSVPCNNIQVPFCKDYINGSCSRVKCKYLHMSKEEIDQQTNRHDITSNQSTEYTTYNQCTNIEQNPNFFPNTNASFYPSTQQVSVLPSQTISLGNNLPLTNAQFTVSLPLGSVSYSTSQQQLITQPSLTNVQYIHDPILSSVAHEVGSINNEVMNQIPASNQHNIVSQIHPQQQVVYSGIIHNSAVSLPQHHTLQPQFTLISSDNQSHSQLISAPIPVGSSNTTGHIISPVAVAHPNQSQNQQYTISQQPPVGVSIFSVATPCSLLSASPTTADVLQTIQHQQLRSYDQNDQQCIVQKNMKTQGNIEFSVNDSSHINSTLTPIYIQHSLPSAVPVTQYRVTALESTTTPGIVIHNPIDHNNLTVVHATTSSNNQSDNNHLHNHEDSFLTTSVLSRMTVPTRKLTDKYTNVIEENEKLKRKVMDLQKQTSDLQTANELLLDQNARLRNSKSCCNVSGNSMNGNDSKSNQNNDQNNGGNNNNRYNNGQCSSNGNNNNIGNQSMQNELTSNPMSEMATITLTVPIGKPHITQSLEHLSSSSFSSSSSSGSCLSSSAILTGSNQSVPYTNDSLRNNNNHNNKTKITYSMSSNTESCHKNVLSTSDCSDYISPTLVTSAIRSIQKSVMPTLHALVASTNANSNGDCSNKQKVMFDNVATNCRLKSDFCLEKSTDIENPIRSSSCPVTCSYTPIVPEAQSIQCHKSNESDMCCLRQRDYCHTPQMCFQ